jgi:DNA-binding SARP family transcriptional activator/WD40 repeat protein
VEYLVLGPVEVLDGTGVLGLGGYRQRLVLAVLLSRPNRVLATDWLVDAVWGEHPPATARKTLQAYLTRLRALLPPGAIESTPAGYRLVTGPDELDALRFEHLVARGHTALEADPITAARVLREALALWRGPAFGDLADAAALTLEAERLRELRLSALADRAHADLAAGRIAGLVGELTGLVQEYPTDERFRAALMHAQYLTGRQTDALRGYEQYRRTLADELGAEPSPTLARLHEAILRHEPGLGTPSPVDVSLGDVRNPYKGLRPFEAGDADDFFGREALVATLQHRLGERFVALVGPSGSGKSSAVLAGLVPRALRQGWRVVTMVPGRSPFEALLAGVRAIADVDLHLQGDSLDLVRAAAAVLDGSDQRLLVVVDQFEELFHQTDPRVRDRFVSALAEALDDPVADVTVLLTVRADFFAPLLATPGLGARVADHLVAVPALDPGELEAAAIAPAQRVGVTVEPALLAQLVADMTDQPGALPQFQYALTEVFEQRDGPELSTRTYRGLGGLRGVVARRAEHVFQSLDGAQRDLARQVFLRLVDLGEQHEVVRRRMPLPTLEALPSAGGVLPTVLDAFDRARLLTFDRDPGTGLPTVELAHEALLGEWPRLAEWAAQARDELRLRRSLVAALAEWQESGRSEDFLLGSARLAQVEAWQQNGVVELTEPERQFVDASREHRDRARRQEADRYARELGVQRQAARRLRSLVAVVTAAALVAAGLGLLAAQRGREAAAGERDARVRELAASSTLALTSDAELGVLLALEAVEQASSAGETAVAASALHAAVGADRVLARPSGGDAVAFVDDDTVAVGGDDPRLVDAQSGETRLRLPRPPDGTSVVVLAAARPGLVAMGTDQGRLLLVSTASGQVVRELVDPRYGRGVGGDGAGRWRLDVSRDGRLLVTAGGTVVVWNVATGRIVVRLLDLHSDDQGVAIRPDGRAVAVASGDRVEVRAIPSGALLTSFDRVDAGGVTGVAYADGGRSLVVATDTGALQVWDTASHARLATGQSDDALTSLALEDGPGRLLTGSDSGDVLQWDVAADPLVESTLLELPTALTAVALAPSGDAAAVAGPGSLLTVHVGAGPPHEGPVWPAAVPGVAGVLDDLSGGQPLALSADGARVATVQPGGTAVRVGQVDGSGAAVPLPAPDAPSAGDPVAGLAFDPSRPVLAIARVSSDALHHSLETVDLDSGATRGRSETFGGYSPYFSGSLAYPPTGRWLASSQCLDSGPPALLVDAWTLRLLGTGQPRGVTECGHHVALDADGGRLAAASDVRGDANALVFDTESGATLAAVRHPPHATDVALAPDGDRLLTVGADGTGRIWDVDSDEVLHVLRGHRGAVTAAEWSADGSTVITSGVDGTVRGWDPDTGSAGVVLTGLPGPAALALTPDGSRLVTVAGDEAQVWVWDVDDLVTLARSRVDRALTPTECEQYGIDDCPSSAPAT